MKRVLSCRLLYVLDSRECIIHPSTDRSTGGRAVSCPTTRFEVAYQVFCNFDAVERATNISTYPHPPIMQRSTELHVTCICTVSRLFHILE